MFKLQAINLNLLPFYFVPMICGISLNRICGQWIARVFDNLYPFNHQLTTNNIWTTDAHWSVANSFMKLIDSIKNEEIKCHKISFYTIVCIEKSPQFSFARTNLIVNRISICNRFRSINKGHTGHGNVLLDCTVNKGPNSLLQIRICHWIAHLFKFKSINESNRYCHQSNAITNNEIIFSEQWAFIIFNALNQLIHIQNLTQTCHYPLENHNNSIFGCENFFKTLYPLWMHIQYTHWQNIHTVHSPQTSWQFVNNIPFQLTFRQVC